jgi:hypothetical protein
MEGATSGAERRQAEGSEVVEYRPYEDGMLQAEVRIYTRRDGGRSERGPYWYFRFHEGGRQKKLYLGRTDDPEAVLAEKRSQRPAN